MVLSRARRCTVGRFRRRSAVGRAGLLIVGLVAAAILGCTAGPSQEKPPARPPASAQEAPATSTHRQEPKLLKEKEPVDRGRKEPVITVEPGNWVHGPYGAGECVRCHSADVPEQFVTPRNQLCIRCHTTHSRAAAQGAGLRLHAPAANGECTVCHHPHQAARQYMLRGRQTADLCGQCHDGALLARSAPHRKAQEADCMSCHNAHKGVAAALLRSDYDESVEAYGGP